MVVSSASFADLLKPGLMRMFPGAFETAPPPLYIDPEWRKNYAFEYERLTGRVPPTERVDSRDFPR